MKMFMMGKMRINMLEEYLEGLKSALQKVDLRLWVVWLEVNFFGQTIIPEIATCVGIAWYVFVRIEWILMSRISQSGSKRVTM